MAGTLTEAQATALREAIASGVQTVEADGRRVTYRSLQDMRDVLAEHEATAAGLGRRRKVEFRSGW